VPTPPTHAHALDTVASPTLTASATGCPPRLSAVPRLPARSGDGPPSLRLPRRSCTAA